MAKSGQSSDLPRSVAGNHNIWLVAVIVSIATFMEVLDTSIANVALDHIRGELGTDLSESTWVLTSYLVANAIILPISGWLATIIGRKRFYMICVALFTISSFLCGIAPNLSFLIVARVLQGLGGGGLAPSEQSMLADSFPPAKRGMAFALYGIAVVFAPAIGPTLGGWITDNYSWHWIFLINVPVGIMSLLLSHAVLTEPKKEKQDRKKLWKKGFHVDYVGMGLVAIGLGCLQVMLDRGQEDDWFQSNFIIIFASISAIALIALVIWELTSPDPIVDLRLLGNRTFGTASVLMFCFGFILLGTTQLIPQLTQNLFNYTATTAGLVITPGGFVVMCLMPLVGFLMGRVQPKYLVGIGMLIEAFSMMNMTRFDLNVSYADLAWARIFQASGLAFLFVPITTASYAGLPPEKSNNASALLNLWRNLGGSFGISLAQTWIARGMQRHQSYLVEKLVPTRPQYQYGLKQITHQVAQGAPDAVSHPRALYRLFGLVEAQAAILSYLDVFTIMMICAFAAVPLIFLLKNTKPGQQAASH